MSGSADPGPLRHGDLLASYTGGGFLWTRLVSQRIGALVAVPALRRGLHPSTLTLLSLVVGLGSSVAAIVLLPGQRALAGVLVLVGLQLAYGLDCADGQVARASGRTSVAGARLDLTVDYGIHAAVAAVLVVASEAAVPTLALLVASLGYCYQLVDEATGRAGDARTPAVDRTGGVYQAVGLLRDTGTQRAVGAAVVAMGPEPSAIVLVLLGALGAAQFVARLVVLDRRSR